MNEADFWLLIAAAKDESGGDPGQQVALIQTKLDSLTKAEIIGFDLLLHELMNKSYRRELWAAAYIINGGCSDDGFDYFRAWLISRGQDAFYRALKDPETLAGVAEPEVELEEMLYAASKAYKSSTGNGYPHPRRPQAELVGEEWEEDEGQLREKFPLLCAKFLNQEAGENDPACELNPAKAFSILQELAGAGASEPNALYQQACFLAINEDPENLAKSAGLLLQAAAQGHTEAQFLLGACLEEGRGVPQDLRQALEWYHLAAKRGNADACAALGALYRKGLGTEVNRDESFCWYTKAAAADSAEGDFGLGLLYEEGLGGDDDEAKALEHFLRAAKAGHEMAANALGVAYSSGQGVEQDPVQAARWFAQAADAGLDKGQYNLGVLFEQGRGVPQDFAKAAALYQSAANQGDAKAQSNLGLLYAKGLGVPQNYRKRSEERRVGKECRSRWSPYH